MVDNSLINGKVTLISTKLYPRIAFYHFLKFWKKYTTLTLFLKGRLTKKRTETKYTKQNRANALLWNFFPHPAVGDIQLLFTISPLIILWNFDNFDDSFENCLVFQMQKSVLPTLMRSLLWSKVFAFLIKLILKIHTKNRIKNRINIIGY